MYYIHQETDCSRKLSLIHILCIRDRYYYKLAFPTWSLLKHSSYMRFITLYTNYEWREHLNPEDQKIHSSWNHIWRGSRTRNSNTSNKEQSQCGMKKGTAAKWVTENESLMLSAPTPTKNYAFILSKSVLHCSITIINMKEIRYLWKKQGLLQFVKCTTSTWTIY